jgi:3-hydroxybutyryl-CoA dehydrogenase
MRKRRSDIERLTVIGTGTMGHSIALNAAWMGIEVVMQGMNQSLIDQAMQGIDAKMMVLIENEAMDNSIKKKIRNNIITSTDMNEAVKNASFIIEAIPEDATLKKELFEILDHTCGEEVILASNTSGIDPASIAAGMRHPERFIVTHFWNPAHLVPLVEIVRGRHTNEQTVARARQLLQRMNKKTIVLNRSVPGFIGNRLQYALFREAQYLLEEGIASKEDIDAAVTYSIGRRLPVTGPLLTADMGGLDVFAAISDYLFKDLSNAGGSFPILKDLTMQNKLGTKTGEGYYTWDEPFTKEMNKKRENELIRFLKQDIEVKDKFNASIT